MDHILQEYIEWMFWLSGQIAVEFEHVKAQTQGAWTK